MQPQETPATHQSVPDPKTDATLTIESLLIEEYKYAGNTAYQAIEDRARTVSLYYILLGILATGVSAIYQLSGSSHPYSQVLVILLLLIVSGLSATFFINIIRLRQSFLESIIAMNVIKEFYIQQFQHQMPTIEKVFRWRLSTIPAGERIGSVTFVMSYLIALMGSLCLAAAIALTMRQLVYTPDLMSVQSLIAAIIVFALALSAYTLYYRHSLSDRSSGIQQLKQIKKSIEDLPSSVSAI
jgi:hypothetical protein